MLLWNKSIARSPKKLIRYTSHQTGTQSTTWRLLRKCLYLISYKLSMLQKLNEADQVTYQHLCAEMLSRIGADETFLDNPIFSDESLFHIRGKVNNQNCTIWGSENPHETLHHECDSPKVSVF